MTDRPLLSMTVQHARTLNQNYRIYREKNGNSNYSSESLNIGKSIGDVIVATSPNYK